MPLLDHLIELRQRLMWSFAAFLLAFFVCYHFSSSIYAFLAQPLADVEERLGGSRRMIFTSLTEGFFTYLKVAMFGGAFIAFPVMATQLWLFIAPGLYRSEKRALLPFLLASPVLFLLGGALAYYVIFPFAWGFFLSFQTPHGAGGLPIELEARVSEYLDLGDEVDLRLRDNLPAAGSAEPDGKGGDRDVEGPEALPALCHCRHVHRRRHPGAARHHHPVRPGGAVDRAVRNLHPCREDG